jgi:hypothetical protein
MNEGRTNFVNSVLYMSMFIKLSTINNYILRKFYRGSHLGKALFCPRDIYMEFFTALTISHLALKSDAMTPKICK